MLWTTLGVQSKLGFGSCPILWTPRSLLSATQCWGRKQCLCSNYNFPNSPLGFISTNLTVHFLTKCKVQVKSNGSSVSEWVSLACMIPIIFQPRWARPSIQPWPAKISFKEKLKAEAWLAWSSVEMKPVATAPTPRGAAKLSERSGFVTLIHRCLQLHCGSQLHALVTQALSFLVTL